MIVTERGTEPRFLLFCHTERGTEPRFFVVLPYRTGDRAPFFCCFAIPFIAKQYFKKTVLCPPFLPGSVPYFLRPSITISPVFICFIQHCLLARRNRLLGNLACFIKRNFSKKRSSQLVDKNGKQSDIANNQPGFTKRHCRH